MEKLKYSSFLKLLCYLLIPIVTIILILSMADVFITAEYGEFNSQQDAIKTYNFGEEYLYNIISEVRYIKSNQERILEDYTQYSKITDNSYQNSIYYKPLINSTSSIYDYIEFIIIDEETGILYTNIRTEEYQKEINEITNNETFWTYEDGNIKTNIEAINQENAKYIIASYSTNYLEGMKIYTRFDDNSYTYSNSYFIQQAVYNMFKTNQNLPAYLIPITSISLIVMVIYLIWALGHEKDKKEIQLNGVDKIPYEILSVIVFFVIGILISLGVASIETQVINQKMLISLLLLSYLGSYASFAAWVTTTIKRIKAKEFLHSFLIYKICKWFVVKIKTLVERLLDKEDNTKNIAIVYWGFVIISCIIAMIFNSFLGTIILLAFWFWVFHEIMQYNKKLNKINLALKEIYEGHSDIDLDEEELKGVLKSMAKYINDIAGGFTNAIEQSLKSERLKTELITNVSHDIKTPLTSIINYVDLLKQEDIKDEKIKQYIDILNQKSLRLKKLIEDLVEASKVSSGNVKLNIETINLKELLQQTIGEFEDKFEKKELIIDVNLPQEDIKIQADNRYMYRIIENLFSNITKYAADKTRVYIDLTKQNNEIKLEIKNISKDRLNISADELMQRFVRGDKSRYTEGSGLGLSIAKSLTELQGGRFNIQIDGDLFKVIIKW